MRQSLLVRLGVFFSTVFLTFSFASAATWRVEQHGGGDFFTLQPAVNAAASGDTILVGPGWYQELHWVGNWGNDFQAAAFWSDDRDLFFIGSNIDHVTIGPATEYHSNGPKGIYRKGFLENRLSVENITFKNLRTAVSGYGAIEVSNCQFDACHVGVVTFYGDMSRVIDSEFRNIDFVSAAFGVCVEAEVINCDLGATVVFAETAYGLISGCRADGDSLASFYNSGGVIEGNIATCLDGPCISIDESTVEIFDNHISGGTTNLFIEGQNCHALIHGNIFETPEEQNILIESGATLEATGNDFIKTPGVGSLFIKGSSWPASGDPVVILMENNCWADSQLGPYDSAVTISSYIWDFYDDPDLKITIDFQPFSDELVPVEEMPFGSIKAMFH